MSRAIRLRELLHHHPPVIAMGVHDGLGARLAEEAGFHALWASGLEISASAGVPDANLLTMSEFLDAAERIHMACQLPVVCDCDTGFGNSSNVIHMIHRYEARGLAAVCMEDKRFPKRNSFLPGRQDLVPVSEFVGKIVAAKQAQTSPELVVIARIEALIAGEGLDEALRRAEAYHHAGADAILIHSKKKQPDEILEFLRRWARTSPVVIVPTTYPGITAQDWAREGASLVIYANQGLRSAVRAMERTFRRIREDQDTGGVEGDIAPVSRIFALQGMPMFQRDEKLYGGRRIRAVIPAGGDLSLPEDLRSVVGRDVPRALLDLFGKPLVVRQLDALRKAGVDEAFLVAPDVPEEVQAEGLRLVHHQGLGVADTVCRGLESLPQDGDGALVCYSDILFDPAVVEQMLETEVDVGLLVDRSFRGSPPRQGKSPDLVVCDPPPDQDVRVLRPRRRLRIGRIGKNVPKSEAHFEFVGLMVLSPRGRSVLLAHAAKCRSAGPSPFGEAPSFAEASLTDLLQSLIDHGVEVLGLEVNKGWMEIHDFEDYRRAVELFSAEEGRR